MCVGSYCQNSKRSMRGLFRQGLRKSDFKAGTDAYFQLWLANAFTLNFNQERSCCFLCVLVWITVKLLHAYKKIKKNYYWPWKILRTIRLWQHFGHFRKNKPECTQKNSEPCNNWFAVNFACLVHGLTFTHRTSWST